MAVALSVVIPTLGRESLARTLASCADADEIVVVLDTARGCHELPCELPQNAVFASGHFGVTGGHAGRAHGIGLATGTHLAFFDDDDEYVPGAIDVMREAACERPVIFRMDHYAHGILWRWPVVEFGNVSTQMYVVPNEPERLGTWEPHVPGLPEPGGDYTFMRTTVEKMGQPVWREEIISVLRPTPERMARYQRRTVSIVTPWYEHPELAADYVHAVEDELDSDDEVIIIDNGGCPPLPIHFRVIPVGENLGFCEGSNSGLRRAWCDVTLFLNNDIALGRRGWLDDIRQAVEPGVLAGPLRDGPHSRVDGQEFPYLDGWCLAGMTDDLRELGGFDATLAEPAYYSDNLLCLEARARGMTLREVRPGLVHKLNVTAGPESSADVQAASAANRERYLSRARELLQVAA